MNEHTLFGQNSNPDQTSAVDILLSYWSLHFSNLVTLSNALKSGHIPITCVIPGQIHNRSYSAPLYRAEGSAIRIWMGKWVPNSDHGQTSLWFCNLNFYIEEIQIHRCKDVNTSVQLKCILVPLKKIIAFHLDRVLVKINWKFTTKL